MIARGIALCVSLACCTVAMGGAEVVLECVEHPGTCDPGAGGTETINVMLQQTSPLGTGHLLRFAQFDLTDTDAGLTVSLPITHGLPTGEISPTGDMHFWDFNSTASCMLSGEFCGFGHVVDDELPGALPPGPNVIDMTYIGDLSDPMNPDLTEDANNQWLLPGDGSAKMIGQLQVTCTGGGMLPLNLLNADESDPAKGARIDFGYDMRTTWRAFSGDITGGTIEINCGVGVELIASDPACDVSLWRNANNTVRLTFSGPITAPVAGEILIQELQAGGAVGADMSADFTYTVEGGNVLRIDENGGILTHRTWVGISNTGGWAGVGPFKVDYPVQVGDADANGRVLFDDVLLINSSVPCFTGCVARHDIDGNTRVLFDDVLAANSSVPSFPVAKPSGHVCNPAP